ncbi:MAG: hypothetical protein AAGD96_14395 [Chloroflexota bacterium]
MPDFLFKPLFVLFVFVSLFIYSIADAQEEPIQCLASPSEIDIGSTTSCAIALKDGGIEFSAVNRDGCLPKFDSVEVDQNNIQINLDATLPDDVACTQALTPYTIQVDNLNLATGAWQVNVVVNTNNQSTTYTRTISAGSNSVGESTIFLPFIVSS